MPFTNHWEKRSLYRVFTGHISGQEVLESNLSIQGDRRFDDIKCVINDLTSVDDFTVSKTEIQLIASTDNAAALSNPTLKIALVTTLEPLLQWIEMYCANMEGSPYQTRIFSNLVDAREWTLEKNR